jgi:hypothetical protein
MKQFGGGLPRRGGNQVRPVIDLNIGMAVVLTIPPAVLARADEVIQ